MLGKCCTAELHLQPPNNSLSDVKYRLSILNLKNSKSNKFRISGHFEFQVFQLGMNN
jgi:hypothetical protein